MGLIEIFVIACGLSMDAFAVSVCKGLCMRRINWRYALAIAFAFGLFQALMPVIGWLLGSAFASIIEPIDHWVAFILLAFIGAKMLWDGLHDDGDSDEDLCDGEPKIDIRELFLLAVATSIDALAVGVSFAFLGVNIAIAACVIGVTTFAFSYIGVAVGHIFGSRLERGATILGGIILILIGLKILLEHLGVIAL